MGYGLGFKCSKCQKDYDVFLGIGMMFPKVYKELVEKIRSGKYGSEWKTLIDSEDNVVVDAEKTVFCCPECAAWRAEPNLSLYVAVNEDAIKEAKSGYPYMHKMSPIAEFMMTKPEYKLLKQYDHKCKKCKIVMHEASDDELRSLPCPKCGAAPDEEHSSCFNWD